MVFHDEALPLHENGMKLTAFIERRRLQQDLLPIGGGFIVDENFGKADSGDMSVSYPFKSAAELIAHCSQTGLSISALMMENEVLIPRKRSTRNLARSGPPCVKDRARLPHRRRSRRPAARTAPRRATLSSANHQREPLQRSDEHRGLGQHVRPGGE